MELSKTERLILANQFLILQKLSEGHEAASYGRLGKVVEEGYELHYGDLFQRFDEPLGSGESKEVMDILDMFTALARAYEKYGKKTNVDPHAITFDGFDGNNESALLCYARYLIDDEGRWPEHKKCGDHLNSHSMMIEVYRRMLDAWHTSEDEIVLTVEDVQRIAAARKYPGKA